MSFLTTTLVKEYDPQAFDGFSAATAFRDSQGATVFRRRDAKALTWACQIAYEDDLNKIRPILSRWGFADFSIFDTPVSSSLPISNTHGVVATNEAAQATIIAFAGTDPLSLRNWISDFDLRRSDLGSSAGFARAANDVMPDLQALLARRPTRHKVFLAGHSLGGALAVVTALALKTSGDAAVDAVLTIGAPRPGTPQFAQDYMAQLGERTFRLVYGADFVASVPPGAAPPAPILPLQHVGRFLHCDRGAKFEAVAMPLPSDLDEPNFVAEIASDLRQTLRQPLTSAASIAKRASIGFQFVFGIGPIGQRTDLGGIAVELLPQRLQDHFGYLDALKD